MENFADWIGREQRSTDRLDPALAERWCATFDRDAPSGEAMPQGIHFCLCTPDAPTGALGEDGHPARDDSRGSFMPPIDLPRRMWAASEIEFLAPLKVGAAIERTSRILSVEEKEGRTGRLGFVDVEHLTSADGVSAVREVQTLVYRAASAADAPLAPPRPDGDGFDAAVWEVAKAIIPSAPLLFRYSALTFNTHRIHYDAPYARDVERYRGLVVHGPLMASLLLDLAAQKSGDNALARFAFRAQSPAIAGEILHLAMRESTDGLELGAFAADGRQVLKASASLR